MSTRDTKGKSNDLLEEKSDSTARWVTLSSVTEANREESTIPVPCQRFYTGDKPVISSALANTPCADLGVTGVLETLNIILSISCPLDEPVISVLNSYVAQSLDFGTAYAHLRPHWLGIPTIEKLLKNEEEDRERRRSVLVNDRIITSLVSPRRVWDLYANRVIPYWIAPEKLARENPWGISHAWVDDEERQAAMTPINGYEWPVPMPKNANLDLVRIEMLNRGAEYAWLDVLCLRQERGEREGLHLEEWKLDVPTIGYVYASAPKVVCYFNGLGRPLHLTSGYFESDRCWFRRAWTLQEFTTSIIIGGKTAEDDVMEQEIQRRIDKQLSSLRNLRIYGVNVGILSEMQDRVSTKPLDKVTGLAYLLETQYIPTYNAEQSDGDAWEDLVDAMVPSVRIKLLFYYPEPGNGKKRWRPSWQQLMANKFIAPHYSLRSTGQVGRTEDTVDCLDWYTGYLFEAVEVRGLSGVRKGEKRRRGELVLKDTTGAPHTLKIVAEHTYSIRDGLYALIGGNSGDTNNFWTVGWLTEDGKFEKLSVFRSEYGEEVEVKKLGLEQITVVLC